MWLSGRVRVTSAVPQFPLVGQEDQDRKDREEGTEEDDLAGRQLARRLDERRHADEDRDRNDLQRDARQQRVSTCAEP